jgi:predicted nucleic acid-binding protein
VTLYLDTSAVVKRYIDEEWSEQMRARVRTEPQAMSSVLARIEVPAAIARSVRLGGVEAATGREAIRVFVAEWPRYGRIALTDPVLSLGGDVAWRQGLRGFDAAHIAAALILSNRLPTPLTFATYDRNLWRAARNEGLDAWPPGYGDPRPATT